MSTERDPDDIPTFDWDLAAPSLQERKRPLSQPAGQIDIGVPKPIVAKVLKKLQSCCMGRPAHLFFEKYDLKKEGILSSVVFKKKVVREKLRLGPDEIGEDDLNKIVVHLGHADPNGALGIPALSAAVENGAAAFIRSVHRKQVADAAKVKVYNPFEALVPWRIATSQKCRELESEYGVCVPRPHFSDIPGELHRLRQEEEERRQRTAASLSKLKKTGRATGAPVCAVDGSVRTISLTTLQNFIDRKEASAMAELPPLRRPLRSTPASAQGSRPTDHNTPTSASLATTQFNKPSIAATSSGTLSFEKGKRPATSY